MKNVRTIHTALSTCILFLLFVFRNNYSMTIPCIKDLPQPPIQQEFMDAIDKNDVNAVNILLINLTDPNYPLTLADLVMDGDIKPIIDYAMQHKYTMEQIHNNTYNYNVVTWLKTSLQLKNAQTIHNNIITYLPFVPFHQRNRNNPKTRQMAPAMK